MSPSWATKACAAIASALAAEFYGLKVLKADVEDEHHNATRFLIMARQDERAPNSGKVVTSLVFQVKNVPAALYKAMGGFATNGVNMTKLESYQMGGSFNATRFYADIQGHPDQPACEARSGRAGVPHRRSSDYGRLSGASL